MTTSNATAVYSTTTGEENSFAQLSTEMVEKLGLAAPRLAELPEYEFCFVCSRATDHRGEHDDLVEEGKARYDEEFPMVYFNRLGLVTV